MTAHTNTQKRVAGRKHTPTPWKPSWDYKRVGPDSRFVISHACGPQTTSIGVPLADSEFMQPSNQAAERMVADAEFMCLAVNSYDHLLNTNAELKKALKTCQCPRPANDAPHDPNETTVEKCMARGECGCDCGAALTAAQSGENEKLSTEKVMEKFDELRESFK